MELHIDRVERFPSLAWVATVRPHQNEIRVRVGKHVETGADFIVEGVWDGDFERGCLTGSEALFGSGVQVEGDSAIFIPSLATTDALYYDEASDEVTVSNSMALLLAATRQQLQPAYPGYDLINESIRAGIDGYQPELPTSGRTIRRLLHRYLVVGPEGVTLRPRPEPPPFPCFEQYRDYLAGCLSRMVANARAGGREVPLKVLSTQSRGYDSTAINALAAPLKVDCVYTIRESKEAGAFVRHQARDRGDDSGEEICRLLDLKCVSIDRRHIFGHSLNERLLYCATHLGEDANLLPLFEAAPAPAMLLTGTLGEVWCTTMSQYARGDYVSDGLRRGDLSLHGLSELRLEFGLVQVAVPFLGARRRAEIVALSMSPELEPWRLGIEYDRPIPRRIAEQYGVPRSAFGQRKMATVTSFARPPVPIDGPLRDRFRGFLAQHGVLSGAAFRLLPLVHAANQIIHFHSPRRYRGLYYLERLISRLLHREVRTPQLLRRLNGTLFCMCVNDRAEEYGHFL